MTVPCAIPNCPALRLPKKFYCAVHAAMSERDIRAEMREAQSKMTMGPSQREAERKP